MFSELDIKCLWAIADDYEEIPQIQDMIRQGFGQQTSVSNITASLLELISKRLATAFEFNEIGQRYDEVSCSSDLIHASPADTYRPGESTAGRLWFYITSEGLEYLKTQPWVFPKN